ncbi:MAG: DUF5683 domain-containing protein [Candidatus Kapabacteria bacterium]|nr:DUF5683 domain-containing protein [Candidatus Kapabacteria bacterium]
MNKFSGLIKFFAFAICSCCLVATCFAQDSTHTTKAEVFKMQKSPTGAIVRSLILPGWGQYYVESYWKIPLFLGAAGTCAYFIIDNNNSFNAKKDQIAKLASENPNDPYLDLYKRQREVYRDNRDQATFFLAGVYILAAVDAYVGAHLFDFDVSDKISFNLVPTNQNSFVSLSMRIKMQ